MAATTKSLNIGEKISWYNDGLRSGTLEDFAREWKTARTGGYLHELSTEVRTWDETFTVDVSELGTDIDGWIRYELTAGGHAIQVSIDGRD